MQALAVIEMDIEHMTGKEAIELTKRRKLETKAFPKTLEKPFFYLYLFMSSFSIGG